MYVCQVFDIMYKNFYKFFVRGCGFFVVWVTNSVRSHAAAFATSGGIRGEWGRQTAKKHNPLGVPGNTLW